MSVRVRFVEYLWKWGEEGIDPNEIPPEVPLSREPERERSSSVTASTTTAGTPRRNLSTRLGTAAVPEEKLENPEPGR